MLEMKDGMAKEWGKLIQTDFIAVRTGTEAQKLPDEIKKEQILQSRFVKTGRETRTSRTARTEMQKVHQGIP